MDNDKEKTGLSILNADETDGKKELERCEKCNQVIGGESVKKKKKKPKKVNFNLLSTIILKYLFSLRSEILIKTLSHKTSQKVIFLVKKLK